MNPAEISQSKNPVGEIMALLRAVHQEGPDSPELLEELSLYKRFHPETFSSVEKELLSAMGLFHKIGEPESVYSLVLKRLGNAYATGGGVVLTPVQASIRNALSEARFVSISAPTSAGKSFAIRDYMVGATGDAVVIVPSRALIAEYIGSMRQLFSSDKSVMVTAFVDNVFSSRTRRRVFVLTPERAREIFEHKDHLNVEFFFFDEAQISEDRSRGAFFDVLVRRIMRAFPAAKLAFAHPFVSNPEAQLEKHGVEEGKSFARQYSYGAVGKVHVFQHANKGSFYFSPYSGNGHLLKNCVEFEGNFMEVALGAGRSTLVFVSKTSLYNGKYLEDFKAKIENFEDIESPHALRIISDIGSMVGADSGEHRSRMIGLLHKGVVIHHGSIPLEVRFLIEEFVRAGFARLCFATSTLVQGVNMPFDVVWLKSMRILGDDDAERSLNLKNLIGRAGRMSDKPEFDYGFVFCKDPVRLHERLAESFTIDDVSAIEREQLPVREDMAELVLSVREGTFDESINMPLSKVERLSRPDVQRSARAILDFIYGDEGVAPMDIGGGKKRAERHMASRHFQVIYEASIDRSLLLGELAVFEEAIKLMLMMFQGKSFREIVGLRFSVIARRKARGAGLAAFSQHAESLPDKKLTKPFPLFKDVLARDVSYDTVVFDTYDYLDKVISFSLAEAFSSVYKILLSQANEPRAASMLELLKFGTNDKKAIMLLRYGFSPEIVGAVAPLVESVTEENIIFRRIPKNISSELASAIEWYL